MAGGELQVAGKTMSITNDRILGSHRLTTT